MREVVICAAVRTAIGNMGGTLKDIEPEILASGLIKHLIESHSIDGNLIDEIILGQAKQSTDAPNLARVASLQAGVPVAVPGYTVHRQCGSGLQAINNAAQQIMCGLSDLIIAGGVESMSTAPFYLRKARFGYRAGNGELLDSNTESQPRSQPEDKYGRITMGLTAENLADRYNISRQEQDEFAYRSQAKARAAIKNNVFSDEIVPVAVPQRNKETIYFKVDEFPRETSLEKLSKLLPAFIENGTVTAGNSSGRNDGAAAVIIASESRARELGLKPLARLVSMAAAGVSPEIMGIGPAPATRKALEYAGMSIADIELFEINEAFAAQALSVIKELNIDQDIVNVNGGAVALGHPLGCSGARISVTLLHEMARRDIRFGLSTACIAGGMGITTIFEKLT